MTSQQRLNVLLPRGIGVAGKFKNTSIVYSTPFVRAKKGSGSLADGQLLLQMTFQEMLLIRSAVKEIQCGFPDNFDDLRSHYGFLTEQAENLQNESENTSILDFSKRKALKMKARHLYQSGFDLFTTVKKTSDKVQREMLLYTAARSEVEEVEAEDVAVDEPVMGVSIDTEGRPTSMITETLSFVTAAELLDGVIMSTDAQIRATGINTVSNGVVDSRIRSIPPASSNITPAARNGGNQTPSTVVTLASESLRVETTGPLSLSPLSPGPSLVFNVFHDGTHNHYTNNIQNPNSQGSTQIIGGTESSGIVIVGGNTDARVSPIATIPSDQPPPNLAS